MGSKLDKMETCLCGSLAMMLLWSRKCLEVEGRRELVRKGTCSGRVGLLAMTTWLEALTRLGRVLGREELSV